jgi:hypothetical protein
MKRFPSNQQQRENTFGRSCARLRKSMGLTQRALVHNHATFSGIERCGS